MLKNSKLCYLDTNVIYNFNTYIYLANNTVITYANISRKKVVFVCSNLEFSEGRKLELQSQKN